MYSSKEKGNIKKNFFKKLLFFIVFYVKFPLYKFECTKDNPILKDGNCALIYCSKEEYSLGICIINNTIIQGQWLNNIILLNEYNLRFNNFAIN